MSDLSAFLRPSANSTLPPPVLPQEVYPAVITRYELGQSQNNQTPYIRFGVTLLDWSARVPDKDRFQQGSNGEMIPIDISKRQLRKDFFLTPAAYWRLEKFLTDMGESVTVDEDGNKDFETPISKMTGAKVGVEVQRIVARGSQELINVVGEIFPWKG